MKKIILIFTIFNFSFCPLTNKFFLKTNRVKGDEAKIILQERLSSFFVKDISEGNAESLAGDFLMPVLAKLDDTSVFSRRDVENCASRIFLIGIAIDQPNIIYNRTKRASDPIRKSDPNSRFLPPLFCTIQKFDGLMDLE